MTIRRQYLASYGLDEHAEAGDVQREPWAGPARTLLAGASVAASARPAARRDPIPRHPPHVSHRAAARRG